MIQSGGFFWFSGVESRAIFINFRNFLHSFPVFFSFYEKPLKMKVMKFRIGKVLILHLNLIQDEQEPFS